MNEPSSRNAWPKCESPRRRPAGAASVLLLLAAAGAFLAALPGRSPAGEGAVAPTGIAVPAGYRGWEVVAPSQRDDKDEIRVILGNPKIMKAFRKGTLPFPDGSIMAKLAWKRVKSAEFAQTFVPGEPQRIEFMVKGSKKYATTGGWGFARFVNGKAASAEDHKTCFPCHQANVKDHDFVFTRYAQ
jgi:hypothetical protein